MSWLSVAETDIGNVFKTLTDSGSTSPAAQNALAKIADANTAVQAALPDLEDAILDDVVNYLLGKVPLVGSMLQPEADALANAFAAKLNAKLFPGLAPVGSSSSAAGQIAPATVPADDPLANA